MSEQTGPCDRCGRLCRAAETRTEKARLLRHSTVPEGLCVNCAMTHFLQETFAEPIDRWRPHVLLSQEIQTQVARLLESGQADARPEELDWRWIVENWSLPFPDRKSARRRKPRLEQTTMFDVRGY